MGLGSFDIGFKHDAVLVDALPLYDHVLVYEGEGLVYTGVILQRRPAPGAAIAGNGVDWWLGLDSDGPLIVDREYIATTQKLSNGSFEYEGLFWRLDEDTKWVFRSVPGEPYDGDWVAAIAAGPPTQDEVLQSDESFECAPGNWFYLECYINRATPSVGRIRLRLVYSGRFRHPNLVLNGDTDYWNDTSQALGDAGDDGSGVLRIGPVTPRQSLQNASFETGDLTYWWDQDGPAYAHVSSLDNIDIFQGGHAVWLPALGVGGYALLYDDDPGTPPTAVEPVVVVPGEKIFVQMAVTPWAGAGAPVHADGRVYVGVLLLDASNANPVIFTSPVLDVNSVDQIAWTVVSVEVDVPEGHVYAHPFIQAYDVTTGAWAFDAVTLTHLERNEASIESPLIATQTPERTYRLTAPVTSDVGVAGSLKARIRFSASSRADVIVESPPMDPTNGEEKLLTFDYDPPSGYTTATVTFVGVDVKGGSFRVRKSGITVIDNDPTTKIVADSISNDSTAGWTVLYTTVPSAPAGSERVHAEIVAEADDAGVIDSWAVDAVLLLRIPDFDDDVAAAAAVVADLLQDPDTGQQLIPAGMIHDAGTIAFDWRIRNMTNRDALKQLSRGGLVEPAREWRVRPDAALDWGLPEEIFADRTDFVLRKGDLVVRRAPDAVEDATGRLTRLRLLGADRTPVGGQKKIITGEATADPGDAADWYGRPLNRTRVVEDSTVETLDYAAGRASLELAKQNTPAKATTYELADWRAAGGFDVGDTIYAYDPDIGLVDYDNPVERDGETLWPIGLRVLSRTRKLGADGFRVELRAADGSTRDVTEFVAFETETSATVQLGDALPEFVVDPQGGYAGAQFRRYRGSTSR